MAVRYLLRIEFVEAYIYTVVAGFVACEGGPLSDGFLNGIVSGVEAIGIGTFQGSVFHHAAETKDWGFGGGNAVLDAYIVEAGKEFGSFRFGTVRQQECVVRCVVVGEYMF